MDRHFTILQFDNASFHRYYYVRDLSTSTSSSWLAGCTAEQPGYESSRWEGSKLHQNRQHTKISYQNKRAYPLVKVVKKRPVKGINSIKIR